MTHRRIIWAALAALVLDQLSKLYVIFVLDLPAVYEVKVIPSVLTFRMAWNTGVNFGLFSGAEARWALITIAFVICGAVYWWLLRDKPGRLGAISGGLMIGGAIGNVIDRVAYGAVADFLNVTCCGIRNPFSFNIADAAIFIGALGIIFFTGEKKAV